MANDAEPSSDERDLLNLFSQSALNDYPNPDRVGCPGTAFLEKLAFHRASIAMRDERLEHVLHCSPCYREFDEIRSKRTSETHQTKRLFIGWAVAALLLCSAGLALYRYRDATSFVQGGMTHSAPIVMQLNLQDRPVLRGEGRTPSGQALELPRGQLKLTVLLPFGSENGNYEVQVLRDIQDPLITARGTANISGDVTQLPLQLNTAPLSPGRYMFGIRRPPLDWVYNPIIIR
jgi:hypothetical protein